MEGHCSCCQGNATLLGEAERAVAALKADVADLKSNNEDLHFRNGNLEDDKDELNTEITDAQNAADEAEESRDAAIDDKENAFYEMRTERDKTLELLRKLEFSNAGILCPLCRGMLKHEAGCELKLEIYRLDHNLHRSEYVHL